MWVTDLRWYHAVTDIYKYIYTIYTIYVYHGKRLKDQMQNVFSVMSLRDQGVTLDLSQSAML